MEPIWFDVPSVLNEAAQYKVRLFHERGGRSLSSLFTLERRRSLTTKFNYSVSEGGRSLWSLFILWAKEAAHYEVRLFYEREDRSRIWLNNLNHERKY